MALDFFAGCVGGASGVIVGHPLDTVKVRLQIQSSDNIKYRGTFDCIKTILKYEGSRGLYKGISSPLFGVAGVNALVFGVYGSLRPYVHGAPGHDALWAHFVAGSISGAVQSFVAAPMELVKTRMQVNDLQTTASSTSTVKAPSSMEVLRSIYKNEGGLIRGVFKGWGVTVLREIPGFGTYFATYEALTTKSGREVGPFGLMMAGGLAGVLSWIVTFPIDVVKTRLQSDVSGKYNGAMDCLKKTYLAEGHSAFSRGLVSTVIRAFPTNAATFTVVTYIMRWAETGVGNVDDGRDYLKDILNESARIQKTFEGSLRLPLPRYFSSSFISDGSLSLGSSCAGLIAKYRLNSRPYYNFYCDGYQGKEKSGLIRERFKNERANELGEEKKVQRESLISNLTPKLEFSHESPSTGQLHFRVVDEFEGDESKKLSQNAMGFESKASENVEVTVKGSRTILDKAYSTLRPLIRTFCDNFLPTIKPCSCWDDHCVCLN